MRVSRTVGAALLITAVCTAPSAAQNQLVNPGFESGDLFGWAISTTGSSIVQVGPAGTPIPGVSSSLFGDASSLVRSGTYSASGTVASAVLPQGSMLFSQVLSLTPGATYDIGFYAANSSMLPSTFDIGTGQLPFRFDTGLAIFVDGLQLLPHDVVSATPGTWLPFQASFVASAPTSTVTFKVNGSGTAYAPISVDDFFVTAQTVTPEPGSLVLLATGLGALLVSVKRRRVS
jgi:hypothetical protein